MANLSAALKKRVWARAQNRCEYCGLAQAGQEARFHIDHIVPVSAGGSDSEENLALACVSCSLRKGARWLLRDPLSGMDVPIFNPRKDILSDHLRWDGERVFGETAIGRALVVALQLNRPMILGIRREEMERGRHPPT